MKTMKKLLSLALVVVMIVSLVACGGNKNGAADNLIETDLSQPITIKWIMPGPGAQTDSQAVWAEFNKRLKTYEGFENVTVEEYVGESLSPSLFTLTR
jgi:putative aldouronate transport system substrate-binding protein